MSGHTSCTAGRLPTMFFAVAGLAMSASAFADEVPDAVTASPDIYKVVAENDALRVVVATWKPGQRDAMHSHPAIGVYALTECKNMRAHLADGRSVDWNVVPGNAAANMPVKAHAIENIGDAVCQLVFVETK